MNSWFILYQSVKVALRLVQKLGHDKQSKMCLNIPFFPYYPLFIFFEIFVFRNVDHIEWNQIPFEF